LGTPELEVENLKIENKMQHSFNEMNEVAFSKPVGRSGIIGSVLEIILRRSKDDPARRQCIYDVV